MGRTLLGGQERQDGGEARYLMANGRGASFAGPDPLGTEDYLVIAELDGGQQWARIGVYELHDEVPGLVHYTSVGVWLGP